MSKAGQDLIKAMRDAVAYTQGRKPRGIRVHRIEVVDAAAIRKSLRMSQSAFSKAFGIPIATLKNWEQGRRAPDEPAKSYLKAIFRNPKGIMTALAQANQ